MLHPIEQSKPRPDILASLRHLASQGASIAELVREITDGLSIPNNAVVPVLFYFTKAFDLPMDEVLPLREWVSAEETPQIDHSLGVSIEKTKARWIAHTTPSPYRVTA